MVFRQIAIRVRTPQFVVPLLAAEESENEVTSLLRILCMKLTEEYFWGFVLHCFIRF